jgi:hypothetical protein
MFWYFLPGLVLYGVDGVYRLHQGLGFWGSSSSSSSSGVLIVEALVSPGHTTCSLLLATPRWVWFWGGGRCACREVGWGGWRWGGREGGGGVISVPHTPGLRALGQQQQQFFNIPPYQVARLAPPPPTL